MQPMTRDEFLSLPEACSVLPLRVDLEGDRFVYVRLVSGTERDAWEEKNSGKKRLKNIRARFVALVTVDEKGNRLFSDEHAEQLGKKKNGILEQIFQKGLAFNGWSQSDVEELGKNSESGQSAASTSD
jgi:hypothetical protein